MKTTEKHFKLSDTEFENQFNHCSFDEKLFTHEAHLRLAWIHIKNYGIEEAIENVSDQLLNFVNHVGAKDKFNKTLTVAAIKAVNHFVLKSKADNFKDFITEFPQLKNRFKELIKTHYSFDVFNSNEAKEKFLEPDLVPFN